MKYLTIFILTLSLYTSQALYGSNTKVVILTQQNFQKEVINSKELWLVEFFAPWCGHCKNLAPEWEKAAKALEGIVKVGAVDMTTDQSVGSPYNIQGFPTIKFFGQNKQVAEDYNGGRSAQDLVNFALDNAKKIAQSRLKGGSSSGNSQGGQQKKQQQQQKQHENTGGSSSEEDVVVLTDDNFEELVDQSKDPWFIEFYAPWCGHCQKLAPEWNQLATSLKTKQIKVGKVDATQNTRLGQRFSINGYPTLKFFPPGEKSDQTILDYQGHRESSQMAEWAIEQTAKSKPIMFKQLISQTDFKEFCVDYAGACVIALLPHIYDSSAAERQGYLTELSEISKAYRVKPFTFLWSQGGDQQELEEKFAFGGSGYPAVIAISFKKKVYSVMKGSFSQKNLKAFMAAVSSGRESFNPFKFDVNIKKVLEWDGQDAQLTHQEEPDL